MATLLRRRLVVTLASATITAGLAVTINLATNWMTSVWAWSIAVVLTVAAAGAAHVLDRQSFQESQPSDPPIHQSVSGANVTGTVIQIGQAKGNIEIQ